MRCICSGGVIVVITQETLIQYHARAAERPTELFSWAPKTSAVRIWFGEAAPE